MTRGYGKRRGAPPSDGRTLGEWLLGEAPVPPTSFRLINRPNKVGGARWGRRQRRPAGGTAGTASTQPQPKRLFLVEGCDEPAPAVPRLRASQRETTTKKSGSAQQRKRWLWSVRGHTRRAQKRNYGVREDLPGSIPLSWELSATARYVQLTGVDFRGSIHCPPPKIRRIRSLNGAHLSDSGPKEPSGRCLLCQSPEKR